MPYPAFFVCYHGIQIDILHALENVALHEWILLFQGADQLFDLHTLGLVFFVVAGGAGVGELAGTLDKVQVVGITPCLDVILAHQIQRADELHALEVGAVKLRHHGLDLGTVEHTHKNGLDDIVIVVSQRDLVAAQLLRERVEMTASHAGAEITRGFLDGIDRIENVGLKDLNLNL